MPAAELIPHPRGAVAVASGSSRVRPCVVFYKIIIRLRDLPGVSSPLLVGPVKHSRVRLQKCKDAIDCFTEI